LDALQLPILRKNLSEAQSPATGWRENPFLSGNLV
jgi:hypothetical protein